jgi:hypothetical protein
MKFAMAHPDAVEDPLSHGGICNKGQLGPDGKLLKLFAIEVLLGLLVAVYNLAVCRTSYLKTHFTSDSINFAPADIKALAASACNFAQS